MDREPLILGIIGIVVLVATFGVLTLSGSSNSGTNNQCNMTDEQFIEQMVPHHEQAIAMAQIAQEKAEHSEIKQLAGNIINAQSNEISQMRRWYKEWYGKDIPANSSMMNSSMMKNMENSNMGNMMSQNMMNSSMNITDLESLKNAKPFDKAFLEQMIAHHEMAVMMAKGVLNSEHPEIRELANSIIKVQTAEIEQMKKWLAEWYGSDSSSSNTAQSSSNSNQTASTSSNTANVDHASHHSTPTTNQATPVPSNTSSGTPPNCHEE